MTTIRSVFLSKHCTIEQTINFILFSPNLHFAIRGLSFIRNIVHQNEQQMFSALLTSYYIQCTYMTKVHLFDYIGMWPTDEPEQTTAVSLVPFHNMVKSDLKEHSYETYFSNSHIDKYLLKRICFHTFHSEMVLPNCIQLNWLWELG